MCRNLSSTSLQPSQGQTGLVNVHCPVFTVKEATCQVLGRPTSTYIDRRTSVRDAAGDLSSTDRNTSMAIGTSN